MPIPGISLLAPQLSCERAHNREGMSREGEDLSHDGLGLVEDAKLSEYRAAVVIDSLSGEAIAGVERVHTAKRERDPSSGRGEAAPGAEVRPANHDFQENGVAGDVAPLNVDPEIGQRLHELSVKSSDAVPAVVVFIPRLIVISRRITEGTENAFEIMLVFAPDVFLHQCDSGRDPVHRNGCGRHVPLPRLRCLEHSKQPAYGNDYMFAVPLSPEILQFKNAGSSSPRSQPQSLVPPMALGERCLAHGRPSGSRDCDFSCHCAGENTGRNAGRRIHGEARCLDASEFDLGRAEEPPANDHDLRSHRSARRSETADHREHEKFAIADQRARPSGDAHKPGRAVVGYRGR